MIIIKHESVDSDDSKRNHSAKNLNFDRFGSRKQEAKNDNDVHDEMDAKAKQMDTVVRNEDDRVWNKQAISANANAVRHKVFNNFSAPSGSQFTDPGKVADTAQIKRYYQDILAELKKINAKEFVEVRRN